MACNDRQLSQAQREAGFDQQRTGVPRAVRPFSGAATIENLIDYLNRELVPGVQQTRKATNETYLQVADQAPSANPLSYYFSVNVAASDPTTGRIKLNQATQNTATVIRVSQSNARLQDVTPWLDVMSGGPTTPLGTVTLLDSINPGRFLRFDLNTMTDQGAYWDLGVTFIEGSHVDPFVDGEAVVLGFISGVSAAGSTVPVGSLSPVANDTFLGNVSGGVAAPSAVNLSTLAGAGLAFAAHTLDVTGSTSITVTSDQVQRAALTGEATAAANSNAVTVTRSTNFQSSPWTGDHQFNAEVRLLTQTTVSSTGSINVTLDAGSTRLTLSGTGTITLGTVSGCAEGRILFVEFTGTGTHTISHDASTLNAFSCPGNVDLIINGRGGAICIGRTGTPNWKILGVSNDMRGMLITRTAYTSGSGTHTYNTRCRRAVVKVVGGGGGGGGCEGGAVGTGGAAAGGGGAGAYLELDITSVPTSSAYAVGAAGTAGAASGGGNGGTGGDSTFHDGSATRTAAGGEGGFGDTLASTSHVGGAPGSGGAQPSATGAFMRSGGAPGLQGVFFFLEGIEQGWSGKGGDGPWGGGGEPRSDSEDAGFDATGPGSGGGGAYTESTTDRAGGAGFAGIIIVEEYS